MFALLVSSVIVEVEDEEEAATIAIAAEKHAHLQLARVLEEHDASLSDIDGKLFMLGTQVNMLPDGVVAE